MGCKGRCCLPASGYLGRERDTSFINIWRFTQYGLHGWLRCYIAGVFGVGVMTAGKEARPVTAISKGLFRSILKTIFVVSTITRGFVFHISWKGFIAQIRINLLLQSTRNWQDANGCPSSQYLSQSGGLCRALPNPAKQNT